MSDGDASLRKEISDLGTALRTEIRDLGTSLSKGMNDLGISLRKDIHGAVKWSFVFWVGQLLAFVAIVRMMMDAVTK